MTIGDPVILRPDGSALYNFATVVDDVSIQITHVDPGQGTSVEHADASAGLPGPGIRPCPSSPMCRWSTRLSPSKKLSKRDAKKFMTAEIVAKLRAVHAVPATGPTSRSRTRRP